MVNDNKENIHLFKPVQLLGKPSVFPPVAQNKIQASVQFIIPKLTIDNADTNMITELANKCKLDLWKMDFKQVSNERTKEKATLITFAFYIDGDTKEDQKTNTIMSTARLLSERFLGLLSFLHGVKLSAVHMQYTTINKDGSYSVVLPPLQPSSRPSIQIKLPKNIDFSPSEEVFSALFWLRRGLAERDPIENFSALMVCLQIMANHIIPEQIITRSCPSCGVELDKQPLSISQKVNDLLTKHLGVSKDLSQRLWKARNAIVAHGNKPVKAETFLELTELKFDAITLAFSSIKLGLGIPLDSPPLPNPQYFITDAFMYVD